MRAPHPKNLPNRQKRLLLIHKMTKKGSCKYQKTNTLKNTLKILLQKVCESGFVVYFCTRNDAQVLINTGKLNELTKKIYFQKRFKKVCEIRKWVLHLHPAKCATFLEKLTRIERRKRKIIFQKNF
jgi:hypothetical protein